MPCGGSNPSLTAYKALDAMVSRAFFVFDISVVVRKIVSEILLKFEPFSNGRFIDNDCGREWLNSIIFLKWINPLERASYHYSPLFKSWAIIVQRMMQPF